MADRFYRELSDGDRDSILNQLSRETIINTAQRLGVDPVDLAEACRDGKLIALAYKAIDLHAWSQPEGARFLNELSMLRARGKPVERG